MTSHSLLLPVLPCEPFWTSFLSTSSPCMAQPEVLLTKLAPRSSDWPGMRVMNTFFMRDSALGILLYVATYTDQDGPKLGPQTNIRAQRRKCSRRFPLARITFSSPSSFYKIQVFQIRTFPTFPLISHLNETLLEVAPPRTISAS